MIYLSYCLDAAGNLIRVDSRERRQQLIAGATEIVSKALDLRHPCPWTVTVEQAIAEMMFPPAGLAKCEAVQEIQRAKALSQSPFVFVPPSAETVSTAEAEELMDAYEGLSGDDPLRVEIESALASVGILPIPLLAEHNPELMHEGRLDHENGYRMPGWISNTAVHRKATP